MLCRFGDEKAFGHTGRLYQAIVTTLRHSFNLVFPPPYRVNLRHLASFKGKTAFHRAVIANMIWAYAYIHVAGFKFSCTISSALLCLTVSISAVHLTNRFFFDFECLIDVSILRFWSQPIFNCDSQLKRFCRTVLRLCA